MATEACGAHVESGAMARQDRVKEQTQTAQAVGHTDDSGQQSLARAKEI